MIERVQLHWPPDSYVILFLITIETEDNESREINKCLFSTVINTNMIHNEMFARLSDYWLEANNNFTIIWAILS